MAARPDFFTGWWWTPSYLEHQYKDDKSKQWEKDGLLPEHVKPT
jgi:hypothetical protein